MRLCPAFPRRLPKGLPLFPRGLRGAAPVPAPFYRQPYGLQEVLSFADGGGFGRSASPTRRCWGGISKLAICTGGTGRAGRFGGLMIPLPGPALLVRPRHLVTSTGGSVGSDFTQKPGRFLPLRLQPGRDGVKADGDAPRVSHFPGGVAAPWEGTEAGPLSWGCFCLAAPISHSTKPDTE